MPLAKIHVLEGRYDERRLSNVSKAVQDALISILKIPSDDFFQIIHELPRNRFLHTPSFLEMKYYRRLHRAVRLAFISGRPKETRLALRQGAAIARIVAGAGISPDDLHASSSTEGSSARTFPSVGDSAQRRVSFSTRTAEGGTP